jgi:ATP-dependent Lon protease
MSEKLISGEMPVLALRGLTVFPDQTVHFDIGRAKSIMALETAMKGNQRLLLVPQKDIVVDDPGIQDLYPIGTVVQVKQVLRHQGENLRVLVNGLCRAKLLELTQEEPYLSGLAEAVVEIHSADNAHNQALCREANALYGAYSELLERASQAVQLKMLSSNDPGFLADSIGQNSGMDYKDKAKLLSMLHPVRRLEKALQLLHREIEILKLDSVIQQKTNAQMDKNQKDYYLREQIRVIREELGEADEQSEFDDFRKKIIGDEEPITTRPADLLKPELDDLREICAKWIKQDEDVLSYALFDQVATKFFENREPKVQTIDVEFI